MPVEGIQREIEATTRSLILARAHLCSKRRVLMDRDLP